MEASSSGVAVLVMERAEEDGEKVTVKAGGGGWASVLSEWSARRCTSRDETDGEEKDEEEAEKEEVEEERKAGSIGRCVSRRATEGPKKEAEDEEEGRKVTV